jgi:outer membrane protein
LGSFAGLSQADLQTEKAKLVLRDEADALKLRVTERYFDVLTAQDGVTFAEAEEKALARQLDQAKLRLEVGLIPITDVLEVQARFDTSVAATIAARNELDSALESLKTVVGPDVDNSLPVMKSDAEFLALDPASMDEWSDLAMQNNATLAQARLNVEIADKQVDIKRSGHFPTLDLQGKVNRYEGAEANQVDNESVAITLTVPLFAGGLTSSESAEASYSYEAAKSALELSRRETMRAVRDAYRGTQAAMLRVKALKAAEESAQSALSSVEQGLTVGTRTIVDVLDAQSNWYKARRDYAQARYDYVINVLSLQRTAGSLNDASIERVNAMLAE